MGTEQYAYTNPDTGEEEVYEIETPDAPEPTQTESALRGAAQGATLGWGEEGAAWLADQLTPAGVNRDERPGTDEAMLEMMRGDNQRAQEANPDTYMAGEFVGGLAPAVAAGPLAGKAVGAVGKVATGIGEGAVFGGAAGSGLAEEGDRLEAGAKGAATGAAIGAALPAVISGAGVAAGAVAQGAKRVADRARAGATGAYGGQLKRLAKDRGPDAVEEFGAAVEKLGIHEGEGALSSMPQSWETYARNAARVKSEAGAKIGELSEFADSSGVRVDMGEIAADLMDQAAELRKLPAAEAHAQADELVRRATDFGLESRVSGMPYGDAHKLRRFLDDIAYDAEKQLQSQAAERARNVAGKLRKNMDAAMSEADPALRDAMAEANSQYSTSIRAQTYADERIAQEAGNQMISLPAVVAGGTGFAGGGPVGAVVGATTAQLMKTRGAAATAGAARSVQRGGERVASLSEKIKRLARDSPEELGEYGPILADAERAGNFAVAHSLLQQSDTGYQRMQARLEEDEYDPSAPEPAVAGQDR